MKKKARKIWTIFDIEKWLWKSEFCNLVSLCPKKSKKNFNAIFVIPPVLASLWSVFIKFCWPDEMPPADCYQVNYCSSKIKGGAHFLWHWQPLISDYNFVTERWMVFFSLKKCRPHFTNKIITAKKCRPPFISKIASLTFTKLNKIKHMISRQILIWLMLLKKGKGT